MAKAESKTCKCSPGHMLGSLIFFTVGLYALVGGFAGQLNGSWDMVIIMAWYFVGALLVSFGKMLKWKSCGGCPAHGGKM